jgi:predicted transcriptional regulator
MTDTPAAKTKRPTPQRTVGVDDELWGNCMHIARERREKLSAVIRRALVAYEDEHRALLADKTGHDANA